MTYPKFDRPIPAVTLIVEANERLYTAWRHIRVDEYPIASNVEAIRKRLEVPPFLREVYERNVAGKPKKEYEDWNTFDDGIAYCLMVDEAGKVTKVVPNGSGVYSAGDWDTYRPLLHDLCFTPGRVRGREVECRVLARVDHTFIEGGS